MENLSDVFTEFTECMVHMYKVFNFFTTNAISLGKQFSEMTYTHTYTRMHPPHTNAHTHFRIWNLQL